MHAHETDYSDLNNKSQFFSRKSYKETVVVIRNNDGILNA